MLIDARFIWLIVHGHSVEHVKLFNCVFMSVVANAVPPQVSPFFVCFPSRFASLGCVCMKRRNGARDNLHVIEKVVEKVDDFIRVVYLS